MANASNGNGDKFMKWLIPIIIPLLIGGGVVLQTDSQNSGVSERQLEIITSIERLEGRTTDMIRRVEDVEVRLQADEDLITGVVSDMETRIALILREEEVLLKEVEKFYRIKEEFTQDLRTLQNRIQLLEYNFQRQEGPPDYYERPPSR